MPIAQRSDLVKEAPKVTKEMQQKLWNVSEELTSVKFKISFENSQRNIISSISYARVE